MIAWTRAFVLGFFCWLVPFIISIFIFPLKRVDAPLFSTVMNLVVLLTCALLLLEYFRDRRVRMIECAIVGTLWLVISLVFDYPIFAYGPMKMTAIAYYSEIGLDYLTIPIFAICAAKLVTSIPFEKPKAIAKGA